MTTPSKAAGAAQHAAGETASTAKDEAAATAQTAASAAADVAVAAKEQVGQVAGEAVDQVRQLTEQARSQASEQATNATQKLSESVRSLASEVRDLSQGNADGSGTVAGLAQQLADKGEQLAGYLASQGPGGLVQELRSFAARKPGTFLLGALAAGVATGRVVKGATAASSGSAAPGTSTSASTGPGAAALPMSAPVSAPPPALPVTEAEVAYGAPVTSDPYPPVSPLAGGVSTVDPLADVPLGGGAAGPGTGLR